MESNRSVGTRGRDDEPFIDRERNQSPVERSGMVSATGTMPIRPRGKGTAAYPSSWGEEALQWRSSHH